jgi:hypothetical protein
MIHRIKQLAASLHEDFTDDMRAITAQEPVEEDDDPGLDVLVKNAVRENWLEHDPRAVWKKLSERVRGPFGQMAVEEPALVGEHVLVALESHERADTAPDSRRHRYFLLADNVIPQR